MSKTVPITVEAMVHAPLATVWQCWTEPKHITQWNSAQEDWHSPHAENDVREGGKFTIRMEARDGSAGFDFEGTYTNVHPEKLLEYTMSDGRRVAVAFQEHDGVTSVRETFDPEDENSIEMQRSGWQAILDNFKKYAESVA